MPDELSRRSFLKIAAAAGAAAAVPGCEPAARKLIPYVIPDENVIPGIPSFYSTTCAECPAGCGLIARVREGRVIKLEGNPKDPIGQGATCARGQAALQGLYNPDRLAGPMKRAMAGRTVLSWDEALRSLGERLHAAAAAGRDRVAFIGGPQGPTLASITQRWLAAYHSTRRLSWLPIDEGGAIAAAQRCFGRDDLPIYRLDRAEVIVSFGADFLETWSSPVELARQYAAFRAPTARREGLSIGHSVYVGPRLGLTAAKCDRWLAVKPGDEVLVAMAVLYVLVEQNWIKPEPAVDRQSLKAFIAGYDPAAVSRRTGVSAEAIRAIANSFGRAEGAVALAGTGDETTHVAAMLLNAVTGNVGNTVLFLEGSPPANQRADLDGAIEAMKRGEIDVLLMAGGNPAFSMPPSAGFAAALSKVPFVVWCGTVPDESAELAHLLLPIHHHLEDWGDSAPRAAVRGLAQPVMQPVVESRALGDILLASARAGGDRAGGDRAGGKRTGGDSAAPPNTLAALQAAWIDFHRVSGSTRSLPDFWTTALHDGGVFQEAAVARVGLLPSAIKSPLPPQAAETRELVLFAYPHIFLYDGRGADKPWLQEMPEPVAQFVWDSWAQIHPDTAARLKVAQDDVVELRSAYGAIEAPVYVSDGVMPGVVAIPIGQGHAALGRYAKGRGANPWAALAPGRFSIAVQARNTGSKRKLVSPLGSGDMRGRPLVEAIALDQLRRGVEPEREALPPEPYEMYAPYPYKRQWGMTIDLNSCTGCSACVAACYAENNVPVVGKEAVDRGRIMSWIRLERFFPSSKEAPALYLMPMLCQQCNHAPCEPVCPVFAAYHTDEGLNGQVYNRCVGTRYCENNCPYKVRRFNWSKPQFPPPLHLQLNPDVTVRGMGVMEKCTFCIQRIRAVEIDAGREPLPDGAVVPACAQACPSRAITFGDMKLAGSAVMRRRAQNKLRAYVALPELNTQPAITYLRDIYQRKGMA